MDLPALWLILIIPLVLITGAIIGWFVALKVFKKQVKDNPPITDKQIKELYQQVGRKPSEKQIQQIMANFKNN